MRSDGGSLSSILTRGTLFLAGVALTAAVTVIAMTSLLHQTTTGIDSSTRSVRLTAEAEVDLLLHGRAKSQIVKRDLAGSIQRRLSEVAPYLETEEERQLLAEARARVREYLLASRGARPEEEVAALQAAAYSALEELGAVNVARANEEARLASRIEYLANAGGITLAILVVVVAVFAAYWVRGPLIHPLLDLARAMNQFGSGVQGARVQVRGPSELKEMAERFNEMADQIERQRGRQRAFLAGVAHDLRDPLNALMLSTDAARLDASLRADHRVRRTLDRNARQLRRLDRMISDFLDAALIETGRLDLRFEVRDVSEIVRSAVDLFEGTSPEHDLVLSLPAEPTRARLDPLRIEQVAVNLISNAIKYSPDGGKVNVRLERRASELVLEVSDHGLGMAPEIQTGIFEPFRRGLSREGIPGVGLGLFIVRRIVEAHNGRIEVESTLGQGSTFRIVLPSAPDVEPDSGPT